MKQHRGIKVYLNPMCSLDKLHFYNQFIYCKQKLV